jgi:hypothetical protein
MHGGRRAGDRPAFLLVVAGLWLGHTLSYLLAIPDADRRARVLQETGHSYLHLLGDLALIVAVAAVLTVAFRALRDGPDARGSSTSWLVWRVGVVQVAAFVAVEIGERIASHATFAELLGDHLLGIGIALQLLIAAAGVVVLRWIATVTARLGEALARSPQPRAGLRRLEMPAFAPTARSLLLGTASPRAPPLL